ncbi:hypothetical protein A0H81_12177 [Grifola frondosa]|uniref:Uncharacterized protein n=1 Tax=Grifola frondosa TaxID=5627 RepID=A0A1C7LS74_GRIFR|nr:hypothetical protein A0H81_12177 [Grifola frondosa]
MQVLAAFVGALCTVPTTYADRSLFVSQPISKILYFLWSRIFLCKVVRQVRLALSSQRTELQQQPPSLY